MLKIGITLKNVFDKHFRTNDIFGPTQPSVRLDDEP